MAKKILIADDDLYIRELYVEVVKSEGYEVDAAANGEEALNLLKKGGYDLVLLDIMMPKVDGLGIMDALKKNPPPVKNGPTIFLTNLDQESLIKDAMSRDAVAFIVKADITPDELVGQVKKYLGETN